MWTNHSLLLDGCISCIGYLLWPLHQTTGLMCPIFTLHCTAQQSWWGGIFTELAPNHCKIKCWNIVWNSDGKIIVLYIDSVLPDLPVFCHFNHAKWKTKHRQVWHGSFNSQALFFKRTVEKKFPGNNWTRSHSGHLLRNQVNKLYFFKT